MSVPEQLTISAVLPAFEEASTLPGVVASLAGTLSELALSDWEIVLVTSMAAGDATPGVASEIAERDNRIRVVEQSAEDPGYGRAVALGIAHARQGWLFLSDADGQFDFADLGLLVRGARGSDAVLGYRANRRDVAARRWAARLYGASVRLALGVRAHDTDCAFKLIRASLLAGVSLTSRTGAVNAEILGHVRTKGARVVEVPVRHRERVEGHSRFERRLGSLAVPDPREAFAIAREVGVLASRRLVARAAGSRSS